MSRRPQILHIVDSRQKNQTYTKNTARRCYEVSDWETYSVVDGMSEVELEDQHMDNAYATIPRRHDELTVHAQVHDNDQYPVGEETLQQKRLQGGDSPHQKCLKGGEGPQQKCPQGSEGPQQKCLQGSESPQQKCLQGSERPQQKCLQGGESPQQKCLRGSERPQQKCLQGGESPQQKCLQGSERPQQKCLQGGERPQQKCLQGGERPQQKCLQGGESPQPTCLQGVESPQPTCLQGGESPQYLQGSTSPQQKYLQGSESPQRLEGHGGRQYLTAICEITLEPTRIDSPVRNISPEESDLAHAQCLSPLKDFSEVTFEDVHLGIEPLSITQNITQEDKDDKTQQKKPEYNGQDHVLLKPKEEFINNEEKIKNQRNLKIISRLKAHDDKRPEIRSHHPVLTEKVSIKDLKCVFEDTAKANKTFVKKPITRSESMASVIPANKTSTEIEKLKEMQRSVDRQLSCPLTERSTSLMNLSAVQTERVRFKKLGRENTCTRGHLTISEKPSINRSMPEYLNESYAVENPRHRIRAIESHLDNIHRSNQEKVAVKKVVSCPGEGRNGGHEKLSHTRSNEERSKGDQNSKAAAFDGLLQYLQDYRLGLRELLVNNNVVIIEPVRESVARREEPRAGSAEGTCRIAGATVKTSQTLPGKREHSYTLSRQHAGQPKIKRHFFYHPCKKVNPYLVDKELPDPDLVKNGRQKYEDFLKLKIKKEQILAGCATPIKTKHKTTELTEEGGKTRRGLTVDTVFRDRIIKRWTDSGSLSSGISSDLSCCDTDLESPPYDHKHDYSSDDEDFDSFNSKNFEVEYHYVAPEVLEKIRACGETTTYYGGRIVASTKGASPMNCIMNEIQEDTNNKNYLGVKFRLVKSNSCGSRLELAGAEDTAPSRPVERSRTFYHNPKRSAVFYSRVPGDLDLGPKRDDKNKPSVELKLVETKQDIITFKPKTEDTEATLIKVQKVVEGIEALNSDVKRGDIKVSVGSSVPVAKESAKTESSTPEEKSWKQEFTYKAMAKRYEVIENEVSEKAVKKALEEEAVKVVGKALKEEEAKAKKEMVEFKEVYETIKRGPENRGRVVPKVLLSVEKPRGCRARVVCDMEFETFEVLEPGESHVCARDGGEDMDRDSLSSLELEERIPMTSWSQQTLEASSHTSC